ncbi:MAG TPA: tRNA pseudouridine(55) synthase TruB [Candidatus Saccharibacteria bacterium]|nr:tRNA pseudouridine(55) synthase TruB [Candidatus Saccharibacteria bacterium]HMT55286.1 tRNA pseudouridine(55) synthase TruB [Candidatus Saccharibacteria bacterium]
MNGILLVDKPKGWTSFDVVNYIRGMVARVEGKKPRNVKVGHTGTLDPAATGLLVICVGKATKQVPLLIKQDKTYEVELTLGKTSTTQDQEGVITDVSTIQPPENEVQKVIASFVGTSQQVPPAFSALKVGGKRAYDLARAGKQVVLEPRTITIEWIKDVVYVYPTVRCTARVGSGTYIRALARDIGEQLGCGAYMSELRRTEIGTENVAQAYAVSSLTEELLQKILV